MDKKTTGRNLLFFGGGSGSSICIFACGKDSSSRQRARCRRDMPPACCMLAVRLTSSRSRASPLMRRHKRFAQQNLGAGRIHFARACPIALGAERPQGAQPKNNTHPKGWVLFLVEARGVEPLSESVLTRLSPGAVKFQHSRPAKALNRLGSLVES